MRESKTLTKKVTWMNRKIEEKRRLSSQPSHRTSIYSNLTRSNTHRPPLLPQVLPTSHREREHQTTQRIKLSNLRRLSYLRRFLRLLGHVSSTTQEGLPAPASSILQINLSSPMTWRLIVIQLEMSMKRLKGRRRSGKSQTGTLSWIIKRFNRMQGKTRSQVTRRYLPSTN